MNRRAFRLLNLFAFVLLVVALYLNFMHREREPLPLIPSLPPSDGAQDAAAHRWLSGAHTALLGADSQIRFTANYP